MYIGIILKFFRIRTEFQIIVRPSSNIIVRILWKLTIQGTDKMMFSALYQAHPIIQTLVDLRFNPEYKKSLFQGKLPYLLVDTNPDNVGVLPFDINKYTPQLKNDENVRVHPDVLFHSFNIGYKRNVSDVSRAEMIPIVYLTSWSGMAYASGPNFWHDTPHFKSLDD